MTKKKENKETIDEIKRQYENGELTQTEFDDLVGEVFENKDLVECLEEWRHNHDDMVRIETNLNYFIINYL